MNLTIDLGLRYIWIDSLCIVQDDRDEWSAECPKMGAIYGGAYIVVAASLAANGVHGLYKDRPTFHRVKFHTKAGHLVKAVVRTKVNHSVWKTGEQFWAAPELPLFDRAWAFQERLLARRVVHFTPSELVWECQSCIICECGDLQNPLTSSPEFGVGRGLKTKYHEVTKWGSNLDRLNFWHDICAQFSARSITYTSDRLPALSSVAKQIDMPEILGQYLAGIWERTLPGSLLWWSEYTDAKLYPESLKATHERKKSSSVPTWSWLSIEGRVSTWGRGPITTVVLLGFKYTLSGKDPYGACEEASIILSGKAEHVDIVLNSVPESATTYSVRRPGVDEYFDFLSDTNPLEFGLEELKESQIIALQVGISSGCFKPYNCLILKLRLLPGSSAAYERLGIADCGHEWFPSQEHRVITLV